MKQQIWGFALPRTLLRYFPRHSDLSQPHTHDINIISASYSWYQLFMLLFFWLDQASGCLLWRLANIYCEGKDRKYASGQSCSISLNTTGEQVLPRSKRLDFLITSSLATNMSSYYQATSSNPVIALNSGQGIDKEKTKYFLWWNAWSQLCFTTLYFTSWQLLDDLCRIWKLEFRVAVWYYFPSVSRCFYIHCYQKEITPYHFQFSLLASLGEWYVRDFNADKLCCYSNTLHLHSACQRSESLMCELLPSVIFRWGKKKRERSWSPQIQERENPTRGVTAVLSWWDHKNIIHFFFIYDFNQHLILISRQTRLILPYEHYLLL